MTTQTTDGTNVRVWDWPVRAVHWAMVILLVMLVVTAKIGGNAMEWHMRAGETMLALVLFRITWGFAGSRHARFAGFLRGPAAVGSYARSLLRSPHEFHVGHNPLGGWMVIAILVALLVQTATGLFSNDDVLTEGPLVRLITKDLSDSISSFHRKNAWFVVTLACVHIAAVLFYWFAFNENLTKAMFSGARVLPGLNATPGDGPAQHSKAIALLAVCALAVWFVVTRR